ncbi:MULTISPECIES: helix-turn-helix transcriptional regulator [Pseudomonas]|uniref:Response regulator containing a CheY-like receiver domain and an HTH DNA-binding domain n=1 Tax=Pseudomonas asplenii TaxID=53407 RepID=A0A0N0E3N7_9PSED|nr:MULTISPECIES: helix-turn-helix transcriptional regulator [Pseudomonas]KPA90299.1 response regulator containing a CheY-like receiver domain and an HTH DNA-binding domain [Pseudomonas fuscovaginae]
MSPRTNVKEAKNAHIYQELGRLISSIGDETFLSNMHQLVNASVAVSRIELSEWTVDDSQSSVVDVQLLGHAGLELSPQMQAVCPTNAMHRNDHPLVKRVLEVQDALLIHLNARMKDEKDNNCLGTSHQCSLISRKANRCCVISLHRPRVERDYSLQELSFLKCLSETLLPLAQRHARACRQASARNPQGKTAHASSLEQTQLQQEFGERLSACEITLSAREKEVCLGLLAGGTVPEIAEKLCVKNSSIETYLKRSAAKLGVSGRHGLAKWMIGAE